jgi:hypothetical protein
MIMERKFWVILILGAFIAAFSGSKSISYYNETIARKINEYAIENVDSEISDDEYFNGLWVKIEGDAIKVYEMSMPNKNSGYYQKRLNEYRKELRKDIPRIRKVIRKLTLNSN